MEVVIEKWRYSLKGLLDSYLQLRPHILVLFPLLYLFFVVVNDLFYWFAMITAFPELVFGALFQYYFKVQIPVALLGALFDSLSFFLTVIIIKLAIKSSSPTQFLGHLSIDLLIAILATFWVLFVFSFSSWLIRHFDPLADIQDLETRQSVYGDRIVEALHDPGKNLQNIYFGLVMGVSAMIPSCIHLYMAFRSLVSVKVLEPIRSRRGTDGKGIFRDPGN